MTIFRLTRLAKLISGIVLISVFCAACAAPPTPAPEIRIGVIITTRVDSEDVEGVSTINAANMVANAINAAGGLDVNGVRHLVILVVEKTDNTPEDNVAAAQRLINQKNVVAIIGPQPSRLAIPVGGIAEAAGVPFISPISSNSATTQGRRFVFRMGITDDFQGAVMAQFAHQKLNAQTAGVLYNITDAYSQGLAEVFRKAFEADGGQVLAYESFTPDQPDPTAALQRIQAQNVDVLFLPNESSYVIPQVQIARAQGGTAAFLGSDGWDRVQFRTLPEIEGAFMSTNWSRDFDSDLSRQFVAAYKQQFNRDPGDTAALTYDAFNLLFAAIQAAGKVEPQAIRDSLYALDAYTGVGGLVDFVDTGDPHRSVVILQFKEGQDVFYTTITP
jgi:branched-chain amino acid transport system substrate-binding protein